MMMMMTAMPEPMMIVMTTKFFGEIVSDVVISILSETGLSIVSERSDVSKIRCSRV